MISVDWMKSEVVEELAEESFAAAYFFLTNEWGKRAHSCDGSI